MCKEATLKMYIPFSGTNLRHMPLIMFNTCKFILKLLNFITMITIYKTECYDVKVAINYICLGNAKL